MVGAVVGDWAATARPQLAHGSAQVGVPETFPPAIQPPARRLQPRRGGRGRGGVSENILVVGGCTDGRRQLALRRPAIIPIMSHCPPNCVFRDGVARTIVEARTMRAASPDSTWAAPPHPQGGCHVRSEDDQEATADGSSRRRRPRCPLLPTLTRSSRPCRVDRCPAVLTRRVKGTISDMSQDRDRRQIVKEEWHHIIDEGRFTLGNGSSEVAAIMFVDYTCPFCRLAQDTIAKFIQRFPNAAIVVRQLPKIGSELSRSASMAAVCAAEQQRFGALHSYLLEDAEWLAAGMSSFDWPRMARDGGFIEEEIRNCMGSGTTEVVLAEHEDLARRFSVRWTPSFVTRRGGFYRGVPSVEQMAEWSGESLVGAGAWR